MNYTATTELEAVNIILKNDGETPVASLDENGFSPAEEAQEVLFETSRRLQLHGYNFNTDKGRQFSPDVDGYITVGENVLSVRPSGASEGFNLQQRGLRLYNAGDFSYAFTSPVTLNAVTFLPWDELPEYARNYIVIKAARLYQKRETTSELMDAFTAEDEARARAEFRRNENRAERPNILRNSQLSSNIAGRTL